MALARINRGNWTLPQGTSSNRSLTSASFSPAGGALLLVMGSQFASGAGNNLFTMSSTFTGQGAWTVRSIIQDDGSANFLGSFIAWSVCGSSPGTGTVTMTGKSGRITTSIFMEIIEITGATGSPETQQVTNASTGSSLATDFVAPPGGRSYCFFTALDTSALTVPSGTTALATASMTSSGWVAANAEILGSATQANSWTTGGSWTTGVAMEIAEMIIPVPALRFRGGVLFGNNRIIDSPVRRF